MPVKLRVTASHILEPGEVAKGRKNDRRGGSGSQRGNGAPKKIFSASLSVLCSELIALANGQRPPACQRSTAQKRERSRKRTVVRTRPVGAQGEPRGGRFEPFQNQFANHAYKPGMACGNRGPHEVDTQFFAQRGDLNVQVVDDFHVLAEESDRHNHHTTKRSLGVELRRCWPMSGSSHACSGGPLRL